MAKSLQEQLLKTGLMDGKKAKQIKKEKYKQSKQKPKGRAIENEQARRLAKARTAKVEQDRQLNLARQQQAEQNAVLAQIKQLIDMNTVPRDEGRIGYQFVHGGAVKRIHVTSGQRDELARGQLAVVTQAESYVLVPAAVAAKIAQREPAAVVLVNESQPAQTDEPDAYAQYQVPDDLMW